MKLLESFLSNQKKDFIKFKNIGWNIQNLKNQLKKPNNFSIGYTIDNKLYGILIGEKIMNGENFDLEIHLMLVSKENRRTRIGSKLLNFIENNKILTNIRKIYLEVSEKNSEAINFYEKNNFVFSRFRHNYYKDNGNFFNAKCYSKII